MKFTKWLDTKPAPAPLSEQYDLWKRVFPEMPPDTAMTKERAEAYLEWRDARNLNPENWRR